jgi:hypothetical protein
MKGLPTEFANAQWLRRNRNGAKSAKRTQRRKEKMRAQKNLTQPQTTVLRFLISIVLADHWARRKISLRPLCALCAFAVRFLMARTLVALEINTSP